MLSERALRPMREILRRRREAAFLRQRAESDVVERHAQNHEEVGTTFFIYFPPEAPWEQMEDIQDRVVNLAYGAPRKEWDPFIGGIAGDCEIEPFWPLDPDGDAA